MFRRKDEGTESMDTSTEATTTAGEGVAYAAPSAAPAQPATPVAAAQPFRPVPPQAAMMAHRPAAPTATPSAPERTGSASARPVSKRVLTVGPDIQMKGEITTCDRVVIEGVVDATMRDVHTVELTESGTLKGTAEVEDAEISGAFEGDLTVRGKLTIYASGRVRGNVVYGEIEIQRGGQLSGNIRNVADAKLPSNQNQPKMKVA